VEDKPRDVLGLGGSEGVFEDAKGSVGIARTKGRVDEPITIGREAKEKRVKIIDAFGHDDAFDCGKQSWLGAERRGYGIRIQENGGKHVCAATVADEHKLGEFDRRFLPVDEKMEEKEEILSMHWMTVMLRGILGWGEPIIGNGDWTICGGGETAGQLTMITFVLASRVCQEN